VPFGVLVIANEGMRGDGVSAIVTRFFGEGFGGFWMGVFVDAEGGRKVGERVIAEIYPGFSGGIGRN
jgi:hypothetical protein